MVPGTLDSPAVARSRPDARLSHRACVPPPVRPVSAQPGRVRFVVDLHPDSAQQIAEFLRQAGQRAHRNQETLRRTPAGTLTDRTARMRAGRQASLERLSEECARLAAALQRAQADWQNLR